MIFILIALAVAVNLAFFRKRVFLNTGYMAVIMTLGIINFGVLHLPVHQSMLNSIVYYITFLLWVVFWTNLPVALIRHSFVDRHVRSTVNRFTMGTWVAGTSMIVVLSSFTGAMDRFAIVIIALFNIGLWLIYLGMSFHTLLKGIKQWKHTLLFGNLFLTTVSTQSIAIMLPTIFPVIHQGLILSIISFGFVLYVISFLFIISHFSLKNWNATNCIFHGALSISGVALLYNEMIPMVGAIGLWAVVFSFFIIVEIIESIIFMTKLKKRSTSEVLLNSNLSHWSRLFTFGMFFTFTSLLDFRQGLTVMLKNGLLTVLFATIFLLLFFELLSSSILLYKKVMKLETGKWKAGRKI